MEITPKGFDSTPPLPSAEAELDRNVMAAPALAAVPVPSAGRNKDRLHALDALRFCAAGMVATFHLVSVVAIVYGVSADTYFTHTVAQSARYGFLGVELFFLISGFVISMSSWGRRLSDFFTSRVSRLVPAYIVAVLVAAATPLMPTGYSPPPLAQVLANLTMLQGLLNVPNLDDVYWTLLVELKFYLLFAPLVWAGLTYRRMVAFCMIWTTASLFAQAANAKLLTVLLEPQFSPYFVSGVVLYLIHRFGPNLLLWAMLGVNFLLCTASLAQIIDAAAKTDPPAHRLTFVPALVLLISFFAGMIVIALGWTSWLRWRGLVTLGALTYPLYLLHLHVAYFTMLKLHGSMPDEILPFVVVGGVLVISYLVHRLVERPASRAIRNGLRRSFTQIRDTTGHRR